MSSPHDTIKELNDTIDALSDHNKDLQQQNHELSVSYYVMIGVFIITSVMAIVFYNQRNYTRDEVKNLNNQMVWTVKEYNKLNHKYNDVLKDCDMLRQGNEALIKHATPQSVVRAIKATPLPERKQPALNFYTVLDHQPNT